MYQPIHLRLVDPPIRFGLRALLALGLLLLAACEPEQGPAPDSEVPPADAAGDMGGDPPCTDGESRPCLVDGGCAGTQVCIDGAFEPCVAGPEVCDGVDQDCDGRADEAVEGAGEPCAYMRGTCQVPGTTVCDGEAGRILCTPNVDEMPEETCNGVDDDCDGATDEDVPPTPCAAGIGACRRPGQARCQGGRMVCGAEPGPPSEEVCNGADDDCDGPADEQPADVGRACGTGLPGVCAAGLRVCDAGVPACALEIEASDEVCNGLDDDCDGEIDEVFGVGEPCTAGIGGCGRTGTIRCVDGVGSCDASPGMPMAEVCNDIDDDCDGAVDEQPPRDEICNGGDDDCDGAIDEDFALGEPCAVGDGACRSDGETVCGAAGDVVCDAVPGDPRDELCNSIDDDCDGAADEQLGVGVLCEEGVGACRAEGASICGEDGPIVCFAEPGEPSRETCNAIDDDCDGRTDEAFPLGDACTVGDGECRAEGVRVCADDGGLACSAEPGEARDELCDGLDDDCDGRTDEDFPLGEACERGVGACLARGAFVCDGDGGLTCGAAPGAPTDELCNDVDDDCDGRTDERLGRGETCPVGVGLCVRDGVRACGDDGAVVCAGEPGPAVDELCDGEDQDCDGVVDEDFALGEACEGGIGACARPGVRVCDGAGGVLCEAAPGDPAAELCDDVDNDCDGAVDEVASCEVYDSCADALRAGGESGLYLIVGLDDDPHSVWCDMRTDGGGWALVANSLGAPPPDQRSPWHVDLQGPAPTEARAGIWPALRRLSLRHDIRFTCGAVGAAPTVDMVFYDVPWYRSLTAGADRDSCFSENDGQGALEQPAIRRDLLSGDLRARGQGRLHPDGDWLEGEDACGAMDDFAVDFDGRGLEAPANGTSWGLFDGVARCGEAAPGPNTRWQIWVRPPEDAPLGRVGLLGPARLAAALTDSGFAVELLDAAPVDPSAFDVIFLGRWFQAWGALPADTEQALDAFVRAGGGLVTEFDGAALLATGYDPDFVLQDGAPAPWGWLPMTVGGGDLDGLQSLDVQPDGVGDPVVRSLPDQIVGQRGPAYFVWPRFAGDAPGRVVTASSSPAGGDFVSTLRVARCGGALLMSGARYADAAEEPVIGQFVRNLASAAASPNPAGITDVCPD